MPRQARSKSESGIYHIILRGINKQIIFEDREDRTKFLWCLQHYKGICVYSIYGYCLMDNHVHLLIKERQDPVANIMKRIGVSYVAWYNHKYDRCGHLFQDRFKSEAVEKEKYLLTVLRYIHQNPLKSGMTKNLKEYEWSSYAEYIGKSDLVDTKFIIDMFAPDQEKALANFQQFMNETVHDSPTMMDERKRLNDSEAKLLVQSCVDTRALETLQTMNKVRRDKILKVLKKIDGISTRQIARITGISQSIVARA